MGDMLSSVRMPSPSRRGSAADSKAESKRASRRAAQTVPEQVSKGELIRSLRVKQMLRQEDVAEQAGISVTQLSRIECGKAEPSRETIERVAPVLGVTPAYFDAEALGDAVAEQATDPDTRSFVERVLSLHDRIALMSPSERERLFRVLDRIASRGLP